MTQLDDWPETTAADVAELSAAEHDLADVQQRLSVTRRELAQLADDRARRREQQDRVDREAAAALVAGG